MRRILFLDQYGQLGGGQQVLLELAAAAVDQGWAVDALLPDGPCCGHLTALGVGVTRVALPVLREGRKGWRDVARLAAASLALVLRHRALFGAADLVYVNGGRMLPAGMLAQGLLRRPAACHVHLNYRRSERRLLRYFLGQPLTRGVVTPSAFIRDGLVAWDRAFASPRVYLVENGLDARFSAAPFEDRFSGRPLRQVGLVGRICPEKGQDVVPALGHRFPDMHFHLLGDAAFSDAGFYACLRRSAPANVHFHGWVEDVPALTRRLGLQLCLAPSRCPASSPGHSFEAAPLTPLQMTALSCLVVPRRLGALASVADELGLRTFSDDAELGGLIETLRRMPPAALAGEARAAHAHVLARYGHAAFRERLAALLRQLMA